MSAIARVVVEHDDIWPLVAVEGEIDASNTTEIGTAIEEALDNRTRALVVDLTATSYLDSAGLNLFFELGAALRDRQQRLHLVIAPRSPISRMAEISGLSAAERIHFSREEAVRQAALPI
jgi:anti-anti-sigma factor